LNSVKKSSVNGLTLLLIIIVAFIITASCGTSQASTAVTSQISSNGTISQAQSVYVNIDSNKIVTSNTLQLGTQVTWGDLLVFPNSPQEQTLLKAANIKLVRFFDSDTPICLNWNEDSHTGNFSWTNVDPVLQAIFACGAQPLVNLLGGMTRQTLPSGMEVNSTSGLPYPVDAAAYCAQVVEHFNSKGFPINYYEVSNEIQFYIFQYGNWSWSPDAANRTGYFMTVFNAAYSAIKTINPNAIISFDFITDKNVLDYWLANEGAEVGSLNFHKYDLNHPSDAPTDQIVFDDVSNQYFGQWPLGQSLTASQAEYNASIGKILPIIASESNLDSVATDPRTERMAGAVWLALLLRTEILNGATYNIYFSWSGSLDFCNSVGYYGMFMINSDNNQPWYPYYVYNIIGPNLSPGDSILSSTSTSSDVQSIVWNHQGKTMILLISETDSNVDVSLQGIKGELTYQKLDNTIPWTNASIQTGTFNANQLLMLQGYSVILLQK